MAKPHREWAPAWRPPLVPARIACAACGCEVLTGREPSVLWAERGWCTTCWFQGSNRLGQASQQIPLCAPTAPTQRSLGA